MNQEIFADAVSAIHVTGQLVRIDLLILQPHLKSEDGQPVADISRRIIMPLEGFIQSLAVQDNIVKQLVAAGVLKKNDSAAGKTPAVAGEMGNVQVRAATNMAASQAPAGREDYGPVDETAKAAG